MESISMRSVPRSYLEDTWGDPAVARYSGNTEIVLVQRQLSDSTVTGSSAPDTFEYNNSSERDTVEYSSVPGVD
jgi:hypothetical protein